MDGLRGFSTREHSSIFRPRRRERRWEVDSPFLCALAVRYVAHKSSSTDPQLLYPVAYYQNHPNNLLFSLQGNPKSKNKINKTTNRSLCHKLHMCDMYIQCRNRIEDICRTYKYSKERKEREQILKIYGYYMDVL